MSQLFGEGPLELPYLPQNIAAEGAILGAILRNNKAFEQCDGLEPDHFANQDYAEVFAEIRDRITFGARVDAVMLKDRFEPKLLTHLMADAFVAFNVLPEYVAEVKDKAQRRAIIAVGQDLVRQASHESRPEDIVAGAYGQLDTALMRQNNISTLSSHDDAMAQAIAGMERALQGDLAGISTGFSNIDRRLGGLEPGLVYVLGGRPGMGKSALGHEIAINVARQRKQGVLELSLEMSAVQLGRRSLSSVSGIPLSRLKSGPISNDEALRVVRAREQLQDLPIYIDDMGGQTPSQIAAKARSARRKHDIGLVLIDHLNLIKPEEGDAKHGGTWATERASGAILSLAKEIGAPVLLLCQLNRGVESREDKRPTLADLRQAGAIEQDAYAVGFVYREDYYMRHPPEPTVGERGEHFDERLSQWLSRKEQVSGRAEIIWGKVRDGEAGTDYLQFDGPTANFSETLDRSGGAL